MCVTLIHWVYCVCHVNSLSLLCDALFFFLSIFYFLPVIWWIKMNIKCWVSRPKSTSTSSREVSYSDNFTPSLSVHTPCWMYPKVKRLRPFASTAWSQVVAGRLYDDAFSLLAAFALPHLYRAFWWSLWRSSGNVSEIYTWDAESGHLMIYSSLFTV